MNAAVASPLSLLHPLAGPFLAFCLLPSLTLHPTQAQALMPGTVLEVAAKLPTLHRHWSAELARNYALEPVQNMNDPALPLAMLPTAGFEMFARYAGALLAGQPIRRCITRADVEAVQTELGDAVLDFTRHRATTIHPGLDDLAWRTEAIAADTTALGYVMLAHAFKSASPGIRQRGLLRLPIAAPESAHDLPLSPAESLRISLALLQEIEPEWLSLFPAAR